ncbi:MAG: adenine phosphoribosyltransferase [Burkholderiales bacterium]|nr:adenine phosphoribosyltransferase [Burkholderiales bacterium]
MRHRPTHSVQVAGLERELPLFEVAPGLRIAVVNILGDTELVQACARALAERLAARPYDVIVTAEAKSIPLAYALAVAAGKPYVVLRKVYKPYMGAALSVETRSITTGQPQLLHLDEKDHRLLGRKRAVLVDDVVSTGSTLAGMRQLAEKVGAVVVAEAAIFTEGDDPGAWAHVVSLGHLPLFRD